MLSLGNVSPTCDNLTGRVSIFALPSTRSLAETGPQPMRRPSKSAWPPTGTMLENARNESTGRRPEDSLLGSSRLGLDFGLASVGGGGAGEGCDGGRWSVDEAWAESRSGLLMFAFCDDDC